jgi:hypothetical protein
MEELLRAGRFWLNLAASYFALHEWMALSVDSEN